jgi:hypothetical protein
MNADRIIPDGVAVHGGSGMIDGVTIVPLRRIPDERGDDLSHAEVHGSALPSVR